MDSSTIGDLKWRKNALEIAAKWCLQNGTIVEIWLQNPLINKLGTGYVKKKTIILSNSQNQAIKRKEAR